MASSSPPRIICISRSASTLRAMGSTCSPRSRSDTLLPARSCGCREGHHGAHHRPAPPPPNPVRRRRQWSPTTSGSSSTTNARSPCGSPTATTSPNGGAPAGAGPLLVNLVHEVDLQRAGGETDRRPSRSRRRRGHEFDSDTATVLLQFRNGALGIDPDHGATSSPGWEAPASEGWLPQRRLRHARFVGTEASLAS